MKKVLLFVAAIFALNGVMAQEGKKDRTPPSPEERAKREVARINEKLKLDEKTTKKLYDLHLNFADKVQKEFDKEAKERQKQAENRKKRAEEFKKWQNQLDTEVKALLSTNDFEVYLELKKELFNKNKSNKKGDKPKERVKRSKR